jgi:thiamine transport system substrate-binding protein
MTRAHWHFITALIGGSLLLAACGGQPSEPAEFEQASEPGELTVMTHDSFAIGEEVIAEFETENDATVNFLLSGDTGSALNQAILSKDNPLADVFFGVDNTFLTRALSEGIFEPYQSPGLDNVPDAFELDPEHRAVPIDYGDVCLNYDKAYFEESALDPPSGLEDLIDPAYASLTVVETRPRRLRGWHSCWRRSGTLARTATWISGPR